MAISNERKRIYRKLRRLGYCTVSEKHFIGLNRWTEKKSRNENIKRVQHDVVNIYIFSNNKNKTGVSFKSEDLFITLKPDQDFDVNNFNLLDYNWTSKNRFLSFDQEEIDLLMNLYQEFLKENNLVAKPYCEEYIHDGE